MSSAISLHTDAGHGGILTIRLSLDLRKVFAAWTWLERRLVVRNRWDRLPTHLLRDIGKSELDAEVERLRRDASRPAQAARLLSWGRLPPSA